MDAGSSPARTWEPQRKNSLNNSYRYKRHPLAQLALATTLRFNGVATKNLPNYLGWRRALEAWGDKLEPPSWIKGAIGNGPYQQITL